MNRRSLLTTLLFLPFLPAQAVAAGPGTVTLHSPGRRQALTIDPATLGYRSSWQDYGDALSFAFDAEGPDGTYAISGDLRDGNVSGALLFAPGLPGLGNATDTQLRVSRARHRGSDLSVRGEIEGAGLRIVFDVTLPTMNFAPTPGPMDRP
ncbi:MAG: hypothetical protein KDK01_11705 [Rhodobacteraceae bacterium]|nr:hypothetical protein [Paracoccaceae bacterium]